MIKIIKESKENIINIFATLKDYHLKVRSIGGYQAEWFIDIGNSKLNRYLNPPKVRLLDEYYYEAAKILNDFGMDYYQVENAITQYVKPR